MATAEPWTGRLEPLLLVDGVAAPERPLPRSGPDDESVPRPGRAAGAGRVPRPGRAGGGRPDPVDEPDLGARPPAQALAAVRPRGLRVRGPGDRHPRPHGFPRDRHGRADSPELARRSAEAGHRTRSILEAANPALEVLVTGGVHLADPIVPGLQDELGIGLLAEALVRAGRLRAAPGQIPIFVVRGEVALLGVAEGCARSPRPPAPWPRRPAVAGTEQGEAG